MGDCTHPFIERATKLQNGECYSCLKAERDELANETAKWVYVHSKAEAALEKAREALAAIHADYAQDATEDPIGHRDRLPYVRMHLTPVSGAIDALRAISKAKPCSVQPDEHHFLPGATVCTCRLRVRFPEPVRTEGAPKHVCGPMWGGPDDCSPECPGWAAEGAPKQEEADDCPHGFLSRVGCDKCEAEDGADEADALRERVERLEKALSVLVAWQGVEHGPECESDDGEFPDICDCYARELSAQVNAALAPEAPVEKEGGK